MKPTKEVIVDILVTGLPHPSALINSKCPPHFRLCKVLIEAAEVVTQFTNAGLSDVIYVEVSTSSLDGPHNCVLAYE